MKKLLIPALVLLTLFIPALLLYQLAQKQAPTAPEPAPVSYNRDILPLLKDHCAECHANSPALVRLQQDLSALPRPLIAPGHPENSPLWLRLVNNDPSKDPHHTLAPEKLELLNHWILQGGAIEAHWATLPLQNPPPPALDLAQPADLLAWQQQATRLLFRRIPTPAETLRAQELHQQNPSNAPALLLDELLAQPELPARLARLWLRLSDFPADPAPSLRPYRENLPRLFADTPSFADFLRQQVAGDLLSDPTPPERLATSFLRAQPAESRPAYLSRFLYAEEKNLPASAFRAHHENPSRPVPGEPLLAFPNQDQLNELQALRTMREATRLQIDQNQTRRRPDFQSWLAQSDRLSPIPDLRAHYRLDGPAPFRSDAVDPAPPAEGQGEPAAITGLHGQALRFNGQNHLDLAADLLDLRPHSPFTISFWLKTPAPRPEALTLLAATDQPSDPTRGLFLILQDNTLQATFSLESPGNAISQKSPPLALPVDTWLHLALRSDGSRQSSGLSLFLNGRKVPAKAVDQSSLRLTSAFQPDTLHLGGHPALLGFQDGAIDEISLHARALSTLEIRHLADGQSLTSPEAAREALESYFFSALHPPARQLQNQLALQENELAEIETSLTQAAVMSSPELSPENRLAIIETALADPQCARVLAHRFYHALTGLSLTKTPGDFSPDGALPHDPDTLDHLAHTLTSSDWSLPALLKAILLHPSVLNADAPTDAPSPASSSAGHRPQTAPSAPADPAAAGTSSPPDSPNSGSRATQALPPSAPPSR